LAQYAFGLRWSKDFIEEILDQILQYLEGLLNAQSENPAALADYHPVDVEEGNLPN
jgi:hypothetical protein